LLQLTTRNLECSLPDPGVDVADGVASGKSLRERLGQGFVGYIDAAGVEQQ
jgi:hypothetical protein